MVESPASFANPDIETKPVGSGPYVLDTAATVIGTSYTYKKPEVLGPDLVHYDKLVLKVYSDPTAMLNAIKGRQLNGAKIIDNDTLDQIKAAGYKVNPFELNWSGLILLDRAGTTNPALKDVKVRQAHQLRLRPHACSRPRPRATATVTTQVFPTSSPPTTPPWTPTTPTTRRRRRHCWPRPATPAG